MRRLDLFERKKRAQQKRQRVNRKYEGRYVRYDMHCHTSEGSIDSAVSAVAYAKKLKDMGFGGMLVTDHDSYKGYEAYQRSKEKVKDFVVLRGIEYDSFEYGHILVILPDDAPKELFALLEIRGLPLWKLSHIVHACGGILGPAHPGGEPFLSFAATKYWRLSEQAMHLLHFDFIEGYNACEPAKNNAIARKLAREYDLPMTGGSDAHSEECIGLGYALLPSEIQTEKDLIEYIQKKNHPKIYGRRYGKTTKDKIGKYNQFLVVGFFFYNKFGAILNIKKRYRLYRQVLHHIEQQRKIKK